LELDCAADSAGAAEAEGWPAADFLRFFPREWLFLIRFILVSGYL
jgi:hypothetical protein